VLALAEGAVGDALEEAGVMLEGADVAPGDLVGVIVEVVGAEGLQAGKHLVDLGLLAKKGFEGSFLVAPRFLGAQSRRRSGDNTT